MLDEQQSFYDIGVCPDALRMFFLEARIAHHETQQRPACAQDGGVGSGRTERGVKRT